MANGSVNKPKVKSLNIIQKALMYDEHLKHNTYISALACSLPERSTDEPHERKDLMLQKTKLNITLPEIISQPFSWTAQADPSSQLVRETVEYNKFVEACKTLDKKNKNSITLNKIRENVGETMELPRYLIEFATRRPPSTFFEGDYDYRYTGGTISVVHLGRKSMLLSARQNNLVFTCLESRMETTCPMNNQIFNVQGYHFNNSAYVALRFADNAQIHKVKSNDTEGTVSVSLKPLYISKTCAKVIDVKMITRQKIITANVEQHVQLFDLKAKKEIYSKTMLDTSSSSSSPHLCQVAPINEDAFLFMDRSSVRLVDPRTSLKANNTLTLVDGYFKCNTLCTLSVSVLDSNYFYVASKHNVFKCDSRGMKVVKKWPHFLANSPIAMKCLVGNDEDILFVSSLYETVCLPVSNYANYLPFKVPSIQDAFQLYNLHNEVILNLDMKRRCELSTTGIEVYAEQGKQYLFTTNSIGDIFRQRITDDCDEASSANTNLREMTAIGEFNSKLPVDMPLKVTHTKDLSGMRKNIVANKSKLSVDDVRLGSYLRPNNKLYWFMRAEKYFARYDMAAIWNTERVNVPVHDANEESNTLVDRWLQDNTNQIADDDNA